MNDEPMVSVTQTDANNYCRILAALGMEEEGDPVAEVERLKRTLEAYQSAYPAVRDQASELASALARTSTGDAATTDMLVQQAIGYVDKIVSAPRRDCADPRAGQYGRRNYTLKDAREHARYAASLLREAWEQLDPMGGPLGPNARVQAPP